MVYEILKSSYLGLVILTVTFLKLCLILELIKPLFV